MGNEKQSAPQDLRESANKFMDTKFNGHGYSITIHDWRNGNHYGYNVSVLLSEFASEVSAEKDEEIKTLKAKLVLAAAERDGITHNLLNVQQDCISANKRIDELEAELKSERLNTYFPKS